VKYFVSYYCSKFTGRKVLERDTPIMDYLDISNIEIQLANDLKVPHVIITNWKKMELPE
jgi:hypothetical protein